MVNYDQMLHVQAQEPDPEEDQLLKENIRSAQVMLVARRRGGAHREACSEVIHPPFAFLAGLFGQGRKVVGAC
jgi:hypothetical protein